MKKTLVIIILINLVYFSIFFITKKPKVQILEKNLESVILPFVTESNRRIVGIIGTDAYITVSAKGDLYINRFGKESKLHKVERYGRETTKFEIKRDYIIVYDTSYFEIYKFKNEILELLLSENFTDSIVERIRFDSKIDSLNFAMLTYKETSFFSIYQISETDKVSFKEKHEYKGGANLQAYYGNYLLFEDELPFVETGTYLLELDSKKTERIGCEFGNELQSVSKDSIILKTVVACGGREAGIYEYNLATREYKQLLSEEKSNLKVIYYKESCYYAINEKYELVKFSHGNNYVDKIGDISTLNQNMPFSVVQIGKFEKYIYIDVKIEESNLSRVMLADI